MRILNSLAGHQTGRSRWLGQLPFITAGNTRKRARDQNDFVLHEPISPFLKSFLSLHRKC